MVRNEAEEGEGEGTSEQVIPKKRKEVTTSSILENFLLLATSLDDTVREEAVERALERESGSLDKRGKKSRSNSRDDS